MNETGTVVKIESDAALIKIDPTDRGKCSSCKCCGSETGDFVLRADLEKNPLLTSAKPGDKVTLQVNLPNIAVASVLLFGVPLCNLIIGVLIACFIWPKQEYMLLAGGIAGLFFGGLEVKLINTLIEKQGMGIKVIKLHESGK